jgi:hypothetical protein
MSGVRRLRGRARAFEAALRESALRHQLEDAAGDEPRTAKQIIDQAVAENRSAERLLYAFAILVVSTGAFALVWGVVTSQGVAAVAGAIASSLFLPAMSQARQTRRESVAIRLLEAPLSRATTSHEAAAMLTEFFRTTLASRSTVAGMPQPPSQTNPAGQL